MTINLNHLIDDFILDRIKGAELQKFQLAMENSPEFNAEIKLNEAIADAIQENDVINLRSNLKEIINFNVTKKNSPDDYFDLAQNLDKAGTGNRQKMDLSFANSLQLIHFENYKKSKTERIHQIKSDNSPGEKKMTPTTQSSQLWKEIGKAISENDIIDLRNNISQIMHSGAGLVSDFELDQYLNNELSPEKQQHINKLANETSTLQQQIRLHQEIDLALSENDINALRTSIDKIMEEEQCINYTELKRIDDYLLNYLKPEEEDLFEEELADNMHLANETRLNRDINESLVERDVMNLRSSMQDIISEQKKESNIRQFIPSGLNQKHTRVLGVAASLAAVISAGTIVLSQQKTSAEAIYQQNFKPYEATGLYRSGAEVTPEVKGIGLYNKQQYSEALLAFKTVLAENPEHPTCNFYSGLCLQETGNFKEAVAVYQKVIDEKDNLFIEQAQWYQALCMIQTKNTKQAYQAFNKIADQGGYYSKDALSIIKKIK